MRFVPIATVFLLSTAPLAAQEQSFWQGDDRHAVLKDNGTCSLVVRTADGSALAALVQAKGSDDMLLVMSPQPIFTDQPSRRVRLEIVRGDGRRHGERVVFETRSDGRYVAPISNAGAAAISGSRALRIFGMSGDTPIFEITPDAAMMAQGTVQMRACLSQD